MCMKSRLPEPGESSNRRRFGRAEPTLKHQGRPPPAEKRLLTLIANHRARFGDAYVAELTEFVAACGSEGPAGPALDDDRRAVATGIAARASAVGGQPLAVGTDWPWP